MSRYIRTVDSARAEVACESCDARSIVGRDEDGGAAVDEIRCHVCASVPIRQRPILASDGEMCAECVTRCYSCEQPTCKRHLTDFEGDLCCPCCVAEFAKQGAEELVEASR